LEKVAFFVVDANVLPGDLHNLFAVCGHIHLRLPAVAYSCLACGQAWTFVAVEGSYNGLRWRCSGKNKQAQGEGQASTSEELVQSVHC
jgi:hypothetical protein